MIGPVVMPITDTESQLNYQNARYYRPALLRFVSRDGFDLINRYSYADGDPIMNDDPSGYISEQMKKYVNKHSAEFSNLPSANKDARNCRSAFTKEVAEDLRRGLLYKATVCYR